MRRWAWELGAMAVLALSAALVGPFGTWEHGFGRRLAEWALFMFGGYLFFRPVVAGGAALAAGTRLPRLAGIGLACLLAALPTTLVVAWVLAGLRIGRVTVADLAILYPEVVGIGLFATAVQGQFRRHAAPPDPSVPDPPRSGPLPPVAEPAPEPPSPATASDGPEPFLARLPPHLGHDLLALAQEDHYLRAHTARGSALLLMRMRDAAAELAGADGLRVHRSWWVARAAVAGVERRERAVWLRLANGLEVPVARAAVPELRAAGWL